MKKEELVSCYRSEMACVHVSPQLRWRTLEAAENLEKKGKQKRLSVVLAIAVILLLLGTAGVAGIYRAGMLDFAGQFMGSYVPEDAQLYVQSDLLNMENDVVSVEVKELYYDGYLSRITVDVIPKEPHVMLLGADMAPDDNWQNMTRLNRKWDENDQRTAADLYEQGQYQAAYAVEIWFEPEWDGVGGGTSDYHLNEDGTLTLYDQQEYTDPLAVRSGILRVSLTPYQTPLTAHSQLLPDQRLRLEHPVQMTEAKFEGEVWYSAEPRLFESVGIRVDEVRLERRAHEIHFTITGSIVNRKKYEAAEGGLWFEFIDPGSTAEQPHLQRLKSGMTATGSVNQTGDRFIQQGTLGRDELHETYILRAFHIISKERYEAHAFSMTQSK